MTKSANWETIYITRMEKKNKIFESTKGEKTMKSQESVTFFQ